MLPARVASSVWETGLLKGHLDQRVCPYEERLAEDSTLQGNLPNDRLQNPPQCFVEGLGVQAEGLSIVGMTQKSGLFKGQQKKSIVSNRHGKATTVRKGKRFKPPTKKSQEYEVGNEISKFVNSANELKAAAKAKKEGAVLRVVKDASTENTNTNKKNSSRS